MYLAHFVAKQISKIEQEKLLMNVKKTGTVLLRILIVAAGYGSITGLVYAAGKWLVPLTDPFDKAILAACNPDTYVGGLDQFIRALSDYTNFLILTPMLSWLIARGLFRLFPKGKTLFTGLLIIEGIALTLLPWRAEDWNNSVYIGANILATAAILAVFGLAVVLFHNMEDTSARRLACVFGLMLLSGAITDWGATNPLKSAVARPRPLNDANKPWNLQVRVIPDELLRGRNSFPSGHTSGTFGLLTPMFWFLRDRRARVGIFAWAALQGFSRVYTAAHFPFCCLMGGILGFSIGTLVFFTLGGPSLRQQSLPDPAENPA